MRGAGGALDHAPGIHHGDLVGHFGDHAEVVGDQDDRHAGLLLQVAQQVEDLRLHGDVERRGRLVGDQQVGLAGQRHGDHHALAHAAGHLVRVFVEAAGGGRDAHPVQRRDRAGLQRGRELALRSCARIASVIWSPTVNTGFRLVIGSWKIMAMRLPRIGAHLGRRQVQQVAAVEHHPAGGDPARAAAPGASPTATASTCRSRFRRRCRGSCPLRPTAIDAVHRGDVAVAAAEYRAQAFDGEKAGGN